MHTLYIYIYIYSSSIIIHSNSNVAPPEAPPSKPRPGSRTGGAPLAAPARFEGYRLWREHCETEGWAKQGLSDEFLSADNVQVGMNRGLSLY